MSAHVILIPGLLGFQKIGRLSYFTDVDALLARPFEDAGVDVEVTVLRTRPTSSVQDRAARLAEMIAADASGRDVLLVGHSTGGLDCRLMLSPGISLPTSVDVEAAARRVRAYVTVSTPHRGSPLADSFTGATAVRLITVASRVVTRLLHRPRPAERLIRLSALLLQLGRIGGVDARVRDELVHGLEHALDHEHGRLDPGLHAWLHDVSGGDSLVVQLSPTGVAELVAATSPRPGVLEGSVVTCGPRPRLRTLLSFGVYALGSAALYALLYRYASLGDDFGEPSDEQRHALETTFGELPLVSDNDGFVPTLSQVWGEVVAAVGGDHLDLMGYYGGHPERPRLDMLSSGSTFDWRDFESTWLAIGRFLLRALPPR